MNKILRTLFAVTLMLAAYTVKAQVETQNAHSILDATWTETDESSATTDQQLFLKGPSTIHFTVKNTSPLKLKETTKDGKTTYVEDENGDIDNTAVRYIAQVSVLGKNGEDKGTVYYRFVKKPDGTATFQKATTRTRTTKTFYIRSTSTWSDYLSPNSNGNGAAYYRSYSPSITYYSYDWSEPQVAQDGETIDGTIDITNGEDDDYISMNIVDDNSDDAPNIVPTSLYKGTYQWSRSRGFYWTWSDTPSQYNIYSDHDVATFGYLHAVILSKLSSTTLRYDIYDDKPLWAETGESTNTTDNILSNRLDVKSHNSEISVYVHRSLKSGTWGTLCLPFDVTVANMKSANALGSNATIAEFSDVDLKQNVVNFKTISSSTATLKAGKPYLIYYAGEDKESFFAPNVTFNYTITSDKEKLNKLSNRKSTNTSQGYYFASVLQPTKAGANSEDLKGGCIVYISSEKTADGQHLKKLKDGGTMKGFRAYLYYPASGASAAAKGNGVIDVDGALNGGTTAVTKVTVDGKQVSNNIYNLNGQFVGVDAGNLPAGIYVRGGKKFVVK